MSANEKRIFPEDPEAATLVTVQMWRDRRGGLHACEDAARWCGATHFHCKDCGNAFPKNSYCKPCSDKRQLGKFLAMPIVEWDGSVPLFVWDSDDTMLETLDEVREYAEENDVSMIDLRLVLAEPCPLPEVEVGDIFTNMPGDFDESRLPCSVADALRGLNDAIAAANAGRPFWWTAGDKRIDMAAEIERRGYA